MFFDELDNIGSEKTNLLPGCTPRRCGCGSILTVVVLGLGVVFPLSWQNMWKRTDVGAPHQPSCGQSRPPALAR